ncbi:MAG: hypothetical protein O3A96_14885, partial [Proteobacteria bacterium]|nr:hypothetical protein [Pseudomonadota bacterium]
MAIAALQSPSVGRAVRLVPMQGQMKSQLHVSMYCPSIFQLEHHPICVNRNRGFRWIGISDST